jgi:hypothetical protein
MSPVGWLEQLPDPYLEWDESLIVCASCDHPLAHHREVDGWWPCISEDCPCGNFAADADCEYCAGKRWVVDENEIEHACGMCS